MTARDIAHRSLLGALSTGTLDDAATALNSVLRAVECDMASASAIGWRADVADGAVILCGWTRARARLVERGIPDVPLWAEVRLSAFGAIALVVHLLESIEVWSTEISTVAARFAEQDAAPVAMEVAL